MLSYNNLLAAKVLIFYDTPKVFINYFIGVLSYAEKKRPNIREPYLCTRKAKGRDVPARTT